MQWGNRLRTAELWLKQAKLCRKSEQLIEEVQKEAMTKGMEPQGDE